MFSLYLTNQWVFKKWLKLHWNQKKLMYQIQKSDFIRLSWILRMGCKIVSALAHCSRGFRFLAKYISCLEFSPASNEPTHSKFGQKKKIFENPPFRHVPRKHLKNTIWHVWKKSGTMFQKIFIINYIINYINLYLISTQGQNP